jgi:hypothetical protein
VHCIHYSGWGITDTPRESAGLALVLGTLGLDKILDIDEKHQLVVGSHRPQSGDVVQFPSKRQNAWQVPQARFGRPTG